MITSFTKHLFTALFTIAFLCSSVASFSQSNPGAGFAPGKGFRQINFGLELDGYGIPLYAGMDFGVGKMITVGPRIVFESQRETIKYGNMRLHARSSVVIPSMRGDYHFSGHIKGLPSELDFYGGLTLGVLAYRSSAEYIDFNGEVQRSEPDTYYDTRLWFQLGARYYFSDHWGAQLEFASLGKDGAIGVTYRF